MIRRPPALLALLSLCPPAAFAADPVPTPEWVEQTRVLAARLGKGLKGEMTKAIEQGGPVAAIAVCKDRAPADGPPSPQPAQPTITAP